MTNNSSTLLAHCGSRKVTRDELKEIPVPEGTRTHQPLSHYAIVEVLEEALSFRHITVERDEYAISGDGMKMFGILDINFGFDGGSFSIGLRNSNDKSMRLALTAGYRVFVCDNMAFSGDFTPLLHKHSRNLELRDSISIAVDRIHRGFHSMESGIDTMRKRFLTDNDARLLIYGAFVDGGIRGLPKNLMPVVHDHYFNPEYEDFTTRSLWSLSNAFTSALKKLSPVRQFEVSARLGSFMEEIAGNGIEQEKRNNIIPFNNDRIMLQDQEKEDTEPPFDHFPEQADDIESLDIDSIEDNVFNYPSNNTKEETRKSAVAV